MVQFVDVGGGLSIPTEINLHATERDDAGIQEAVRSAVTNFAQEKGFPLDKAKVAIGAGKPFAVLPLAPDIFDVESNTWAFTPTTAGTHNSIISSIKTPRDSRIVIWGFTDRSPTPQFTTMQFTIDGDTQPLIHIERYKSFGLNTPFGREVYFPRDFILEIGGARELTLSVWSSGLDVELFQLNGIMVVPRNLAISKDIGAATS